MLLQRFAYHLGGHARLHLLVVVDHLLLLPQLQCELLLEAAFAQGGLAALVGCTVAQFGYLGLFGLHGCLRAVLFFKHCHAQHAVVAFHRCAELGDFAVFSRKLLLGFQPGHFGHAVYLFLQPFYLRLTVVQLHVFGAEAFAHALFGFGVLGLPFGEHALAHFGLTFVEFFAECFVPHLRGYGAERVLVYFEHVVALWAFQFFHASKLRKNPERKTPSSYFDRFIGCGLL